MRGSLWLAAGAAGVGLYTALRSAGTQRSERGREPGRHGPRVVILGSGFAGLSAARALMRRLGGRCRVLLIDRHNYHLFTPLLFQVSTCDISPYDVAYPIRQFIGGQGIAFRRGMVTGIDLDQRRVELSDGEVTYDYLVIALGSATNFFGNRTAMEYTLPMKWLEDGVAIRHRMIDLLERAATTSDPEERRSLLTFAVVGGGATGVETAGALADFLNRTARAQYPTLDLDRARVVVVEATGKLLGQMSDRMAAVALDRLRAMGIEVWLDTQAREVGPHHLTLEDGRTLPTGAVVWAAGVRAPDVVAALEAPHGKGGGLVVNRYLQVEGRPEVYAVGDNAYLEDPRTRRPVPLLAQAAVQEGEAVAKNIARALDGIPQRPFHYRSLGSTVTLGSRAGVAEIGGIDFDGLAGNLAWRLIHLARTPGFRNQLTTALNWTFAFAYHQHTARLEMEPRVATAEAAGAAVEVARRTQRGRAA